MKYKVTFINEAATDKGIKLNTLRGSDKQKAWANSLRQNALAHFRGKVEDEVLEYALNDVSNASDVIEGRRIYTDCDETQWEYTFEYSRNAVRLNKLAKTKSVKIFIPKELYAFEDESESVYIENGRLRNVHFKSPVDYSIHGRVCRYTDTPLSVRKGDKVSLRINETRPYGTDDYEVTEDGVYVNVKCTKGFTPELDCRRFCLDTKNQPKWRVDYEGPITNLKTWGVIVDYLNSLNKSI
jgi:hypothetical protein